MINTLQNLLFCDTFALAISSSMMEKSIEMILVWESACEYEMEWNSSAFNGRKAGEFGIHFMPKLEL